MRIVSTKEMKDIEKKASEKYHFHENHIIENVGKSASIFILDQIIPQYQNSDIVFLIGKGNNGADGLSIARHLSSLGHNSYALMFFDEKESSERNLEQVKMAKAFGVSIIRIKELQDVESFVDHLSPNIIFIDALFGTGVHLPLSHFIYEVIHFVNSHSSCTIAIDMPSGVQGDTGYIQGNAIKANFTLAVGFPKLGYFLTDGQTHIGEVEILDVGLPFDLKQEEGDKYLLFLDMLKGQSELRNKFSDKKFFGHTLILGGSHGLTGAVSLAGQAALKSGSGLVTTVTWEPQYHEMIPRLIPELMTGFIPLDTSKWGPLIQGLDKYASIVIGPGLARSTRARKLVLEVLESYNGPVVLDADAINVLNLREDAKIFALRNGPTLLTPHYGEFSRFTGISFEDIKSNPLTHLKNLIEEINCAVLLKGACTFLGFPNGKTYFNYFPNDGMATAGTGDVLAGILGGLMSQESLLKEKVSLVNRYDKFIEIIAEAVLIHTEAGRISSQTVGGRSMTAMNVVHSLQQVFKEIDGE